MPPKCIAGLFHRIATMNFPINQLIKARLLGNCFKVPQLYKPLAEITNEAALIALTANTESD